jgi:arsenate reductase
VADDDVTIWFNQSCSKCNSALEILHGRGVDPNVVEYLEHPPTADEIRDVLDKLGLRPRDLIRSAEPRYAELGLEDATEAEVIEAMAANPILIERPVVVKGTRAVIGRPPERVVDLLGET